MRPRNARLHKRSVFGIAILSAGILMIAGTSACLRLRGTSSEMATAVAILHQNQAPPANTPDSPAPNPSGPLAPPTDIDLSPLTVALLNTLEPAPPFVTRSTLDWLDSTLYTLRQQARATPDDEALDPRAHSLEDITNTMCARVANSKVLLSWRENAATAGPSSPSLPESPLAQGLHWLVKCHMIKSEGVAAAAAYVDLCRTFPTTPRDTDLLPALLDLIDGPVPEPLARDLPVYLDNVPDLELARRLRVRAARTVTQAKVPRPEATEDAPLSERLLASCASLSREEFLACFVPPNPCARMFDVLDQVLALPDLPPYALREQMAALRATIPASATATRAMVDEAATLNIQRHCRHTLSSVLQTVIALKRYKAAHSQYPESLDDLTPTPIPALPQDPFDGLRLKYKRVGEGFDIVPASLSSAPKQTIWRTRR